MNKNIKKVLKTLEKLNPDAEFDFANGTIVSSIPEEEIETNNDIDIIDGIVMYNDVELCDFACTEPYIDEAPEIDQEALNAKVEEVYEKFDNMSKETTELENNNESVEEKIDKIKIDVNDSKNKEISIEENTEIENKEESVEENNDSEETTESIDDELVDEDIDSEDYSSEDDIDLDSYFDDDASLFDTNSIDNLINGKKEESKEETKDSEDDFTVDVSDIDFEEEKEHQVEKATNEELNEINEKIAKEVNDELDNNNNISTGAKELPKSGTYITKAEITDIDLSEENDEEIEEQNIEEIKETKTEEKEEPKKEKKHRFRKFVKKVLYGIRYGIGKFFEFFGNNDIFSYEETELDDVDEEEKNRAKTIIEIRKNLKAYRLLIENNEKLVNKKDIIAFNGLIDIYTEISDRTSIDELELFLNKIIEYKSMTENDLVNKKEADVSAKMNNIENKKANDVNKDVINVKKEEKKEENKEESKKENDDIIDSNISKDDKKLLDLEDTLLNKIEFLINKNNLNDDIKNKYSELRNLYDDLCKSVDENSLTPSAKRYRFNKISKKANELLEIINSNTEEKQQDVKAPIVETTQEIKPPVVETTQEVKPRVVNVKLISNSDKTNNNTVDVNEKLNKMREQETGTTDLISKLKDYKKRLEELKVSLEICDEADREYYEAQKAEIEREIRRTNTDIKSKEIVYTNECEKMVDDMDKEREEAFKVPEETVDRLMNEKHNEYQEYLNSLSYDAFNPYANVPYDKYLEYADLERQKKEFLDKIEKQKNALLNNEPERYVFNPKNKEMKRIK